MMKHTPEMMSQYQKNLYWVLNINGKIPTTMAMSIT